jgi:hypothetical protein
MARENKEKKAAKKFTEKNSAGMPKNKIFVIFCKITCGSNLSSA